MKENVFEVSFDFDIEFVLNFCKGIKEQLLESRMMKETKRSLKIKITPC